MYEGTWKDDMKHGGGKETYSDGATYEGRFQEGSRHGHGTLTYANGDVYGAPRRPPPRRALRTRHSLRRSPLAPQPACAAARLRLWWWLTGVW